ncbi:hypothetical protein MTR_6g029435 [Medicago truncatula]|uniref:Uncharacterized protein n=1 Tax=Medicago truncatula TaxID=3880 RepID=A0A072UIF0_MEDTR|nr:hypothetical protein MTR_6g029435 [Medicago truncatula]
MHMWHSCHLSDVTCFRYQTALHLCPLSRCPVLGVTGCAKSPTSDIRCPNDVFINGSNPNLTSRFCEIVLNPTTIIRFCIKDKVGG